MKSKRIFLPEKRPSPKKTIKPQSNRIIFPGVNSLNISQRQRSEAVGLVMIGISAFAFSLLHFLSGSKVEGWVNFLFVQIGMGVYIIPAIIGLMGVQRFLEKPFENLSLRVAGSIGLLFFGLGFLGMEGGKMGIVFFGFFSSKFGKIPCKILFFFFTLSALVFALDILYKDLLTAVAVISKLFLRFLILAWEAPLALLALLIEGVKNSFDLILRGISYLATTFKSSEDPLPESGEFRLIPFFKSNHGDENGMKIENPTEKNEIPFITDAETLKETPKEKQLLPEEKNNVVTLNPPISANSFNVRMEEIVPVSTVVNVFPGNGVVQGVVESLVSENRGTPVSPQFEGLGKEKVQELGEKSARTPEFESSEEIENPEDEEPKDNSDLPVSLDDHPIDRDLLGKNDIDPSATENMAPEALLPPLDLLNVTPGKGETCMAGLEERSTILLKTLEEFGIKAQITAVVEGPAVSRFELKPAPGVKVSRITSLIDDIALALAAPAIRIEAPIPGKQAMGIEIPNPKPNPVFFYDLVKNENFHSKKSLLNLALGVTISGRPVFADLIDMPHLLIAGSTGSGKSVCINTIIASILFQARASEVKMVMIDPKIVELSSYNGIPHLISPVVTDPKKASGALLWAVEEMTRRYELLADCDVRNISTFNEEISRLKKEVDPELEPMPYIVIIIDELADLMMTASAQVESSICRLAQMARAVGIHLIIATQRPSVDVLTGIIKANLPSRIAFSVASHIDSRTILDNKGAERLLGKGDMLFVPKGLSKPLRIQGAFISDRELKSIIDYVSTQGKPEYVDIAPTSREEDKESEPEQEIEDDDDAKLLNVIENYLLTQEKTSTSMLQRKFKIGYNRAARIMDILEEKGFVSPLDGSNKRRVIGRRSNP